MHCLYKIEAISASSATFIYRYIQSMGGQCLRRGSAVITDFGFDIECPLELLTHISTVNDRLSGNDLEKWAVS